MIIIEKIIPVRFYQESSGKEPVYIWLMKLNKADRKIIGEDIKTVQMRWPSGYPLVKPLGVGLWEIRSTLNNRITRIIFTFNGGYMVLLHGFIKKTQKTSLKEIRIAQKRKQNMEYL